MPRATQRYPFEVRVLLRAQEVYRKLTPATEGYGLLVVFGDTQTVVHPPRPTSELHALVGVLKARGGAFVFYDPFDAPDYMSLQWNAVPRTRMEQWLEQAFDEVDFVAQVRSAGLSRVGLQTPDQFPSTWSVLF